MAQKKISDLPIAPQVKADALLELSQDATSYKANVSQFWRKNAIINGTFDVWQLGTTITAPSSGQYAADCWFYSKTGAMVHDVSRVVGAVFSDRTVNFALKVDCTTVDSSLAASDQCQIIQPIEGNNWVALANHSPVTLSFYVKATLTGTYCVALRNAGADRSCVMEYTVSQADTWEKKTVTFPASPTAGSWDFGTGVGVYLSFVLAAGTDWQTTAGAWQTGNFIATVNQVNACNNTSNDFTITGVQLESGAVATLLEQRTIQEEIILCQRYFCKTYEIGTAPAAVNELGMIGMVATGTGAGDAATYWKFPVAMRSVPTITFYSAATGASGNWRRNSAAADVAVTGVASATCSTGTMIQNNAAVTDTEIVTGHVTAAARL